MNRAYIKNPSMNVAHPTNPVEEGIRMLTQKLLLYDT